MQHIIMFTKYNCLNIPEISILGCPREIVNEIVYFVLTALVPTVTYAISVNDTGNLSICYYVDATTFRLGATLSKYILN